MKIWKMLFCSVIYATAPSITHASFPMRIAFEIESTRYKVGENFPITVRLVNPNNYDVYLDGFDFGALEPQMHILFPGEDEYKNASLAGTIDAHGGAPILIPAQSQIEMRRLIYSNTKLDGSHRVMPSGNYRIRFRTFIGALDNGRKGKYLEVEWVSDEVGFVLTEPSGRDRLGLEFLRAKATELSEQLRNPKQGFNLKEFQIRYSTKFIEQYPDTVYAPEIRLELAKLLKQEIYEQQSPFYKDPQMIDLLVECLSFCIQRGGAYSEEFLKWDDEGGGRHVIGFAAMNGRHELLKQIIEALDRKYPDDVEAKMYRRTLLLGVTQSIESARTAAAELNERFPGGRFADQADRVVRNLERKHEQKREE